MSDFQELFFLWSVYFVMVELIIFEHAVCLSPFLPFPSSKQTKIMGAHLYISSSGSNTGASITGPLDPLSSCFCFPSILFVWCGFQIQFLAPIHTRAPCVRVVISPQQKNKVGPSFSLGLVIIFRISHASWTAERLLIVRWESASSIICEPEGNTG